MNYSTYFQYVFPAVFGIITFFFLFIGLRGLITKKPFLISTKWNFAIVTLCFAPNVFNPILFKDKWGDFDLLTWLFPIMFIPMLLMMWMQMRGYIAFGVTDKSLRDALTEALNEKNIDFEESLSSIKLTKDSSEIQVSVQSWMGTGQIKMKKSKDKQILKDIANGINTYFKKTKTEINMTTCIHYLIIGILFMGIAFSFQIKSKSLFVKDGIKNHYYDTGEVKCEHLYVNGDRYGINKKFYKSGALKNEWLYEDGKLNGMSKEYYESGELRFEYMYSMGKLSGVTTEYHRDGSLSHERTYKNNEEI
jgi:antitoxin component YwqK of YwqJK toxin-antitoxin module